MSIVSGEGSKAARWGADEVTYVGVVDAMSTVMICDRRNQVTRIVGNRRVVSGVTSETHIHLPNHVQYKMIAGLAALMVVNPLSQ